MDVLPVRMTAQEEGSFSHISMKERIPGIIKKAMVSLDEYQSEFTKVHGEKGTKAKEKAYSLLNDLLEQLNSDQPFKPLTDNYVDTDIWNQYLENHENNENISWFRAPWLYAECYMYRRIHEALMLSSPISNFDVFKDLKCQAFLESQEPVIILCNYLQELKRKIETLNENDLKQEFLRLLQISLWGNKCDLSLSGGRSSAQFITPMSVVEKLKSFIIVNHMDSVWSVLITRKKNQEKISTRVDFILDNSGFELYTDLVMADFMIKAKLASEIYFHGKSIPWFVSDTGKNDLNWLIDELKKSRTSCMSKCGSAWEEFFQNHTWNYRDHMFWTLPHEYSAMSQVAPDLYADLQKSNLILFKGDLNYRKLLGDRKWTFTVPFHEALNGFHPAPLCSIRTIKAEIQVGLAPGQGESIAVSEPTWMIIGKYGIFQFDGPL
ncbi:damage-control phosphatase ARMT1-like [Gracilinanus agilis]|uniref:damage-control phosphatase ARMT1-like n=1 Tax=Gracilinanus agilis TaxID=191870 RepID=UPI001CFE0F7A|nr:damage-control phosphatase ARMT1-like [Gracilinanus agilis]XP_044527631.1 damage-control phosphatase ARMT1-like [Gracilinanus agilis]